MKRHIIVFICLLVVHPVAARGAVPPEMTAAQARSTLLTYLQPPDTTLTYTPAVGQWRGHSYYQFHGDAGGGPGADGGGHYNIDAASGEIRISYNAPGAPASAPRLPAQSQLARAVAFAQVHYAGFSVDSFALIDTGYENDYSGNYYVDFVRKTPMLIDVPQHIEIVLAAATGAVKEYIALNLALTVGPVPDISSDQAVVLGRQWIANNISADPADGQLQSAIDLGSDPITLKVVVGFMLDQELRYEICYTRMVVYVDGHSGAATGTDGYAGRGSRRTPVPPRLTLRKREELVRLVRAGTNADFNKPVIETGGDAYIWSKYLAVAGISVSTNHDDAVMRGSNGQHSMLHRSSTTGTPGLLVRRDGVYVSLRAACTLGAPFRRAGARWEYVPPAAAPAFRPKANGLRSAATRGIS